MHSDVFVEYISDSEKDLILEREFYNRYFADFDENLEDESGEDESLDEEGSESEESEEDTQNEKDSSWDKCENGIETDYEYIENYNGIVMKL